MESAASQEAPQADASEMKMNRLPLDEKLFISVDESELAFLKEQTGIQDDKALKEHITQIQAEAYAVHPYPCIRRFTFARHKMSRYPAYKDLLRLGKERKDALLIDIGCCGGTDLRKAIADGFPKEQVLASDLRSQFWNLGHRLFNSTPETFPVPFIQGDIFDPAFLAVAPIPASVSGPTPDLVNLTSLTPLQGRISAIHASSFFHLFSEEQQLEIARKFASLLSPKPGSIVFGAHGGRPEKGYRLEVTRPTSHGTPMFCHSVESWTEMWERDVFGIDADSKGSGVKVSAILREVERKDLGEHELEGTQFWALIWTVTRL